MELIITAVGDQLDAEENKQLESEYQFTEGALNLEGKSQQSGSL